MSYTILLYLFCLTSVSDDVISVVGVLSIWQCYGYNETCGMDLPARPHILNGSSTLTVEDLPTEDKLPVSMDNLLSKILEEQSSSYGLLILEAGNTSLIEWQLESSNSNFKMESSSETSPPLVQESFVRNLTIYHFNASLYEGRPDQVTIVAPHSSLTFHLKQNCVISNCHHTALIFAPLRWTTAISNAFPLQFNKVRMSDCEICLSLPLPAELIRVCPQIQLARWLLIHQQICPSKKRTDNAAYHGVISGKMMRCELGNFTRDTETDVYFIRSRTLHNITLQKQKPVRLQPSCSSTNLTVSLSNDLLGLLIACGDACPTGLIPCKNVIAEYSALGKGAVCIGDGDHVIVRFGKAATLGISDPVTVLNTRLPLYVSKTIPHPNFTLSYSSEVMSCMTEVLVEVKRVTGDGGRPLHYTWKAVNASVELSRVFEGATNRTVSLPTKLLKHEVELSVTGCNFVNLCTTSDAIRLRPVTAEASLSVSLGGVSRSAVPSTAIRIRAVPELSRCNETHTIVPNDAQYNWSINGQFVTNDDSYRIPAFAYGVGDSVDVVVEVNYRDVPSTQHLRATVSETITFVAEELVAMVDAVSRTVAFDAAVVIDASGSKNPNERNGFVTHVWSCLNITSRKKCELPPLVELKSSILRIPARILNLGMSFNFSDNVRAENMSETVWSMVTIGPPKLPQISFIPFSSNKVSVGDYVRIQAFVTVQNSWLNTSWEIVRTSDTGYINISTFLENPISSFTQAQLSASNRVAVSLTIPPVDINLYPNWTGLQPGVQYAIRLIANSSDGCSFADVQIVVNAPPTVGIVEVMPTEGAIALTTQIEFRMGDGWYDDDMPLQYRFGIVILMKDNSKQSYWFTRTASRQNPGCGKFVGFRALLEVCDLFSSCSVAESEMFEVSQSTNITVAIVDLVAAINSDMSNGNIFDSLINMHALDIQKCEKDFDTVTADKITTKLLLTLDEDSDSNDYKEVLSSASTIMNAVSPSADDMLVMYDLLLDKNQRIVDVYMLNIHDFLSAFCIQLDTSSSRIMSAQGNGYTMIQAQSLVPGSQSFSNSSFSIAGVHEGAIELLDPLSGEPVPLVDTTQYTVYIPLVNYDPANYYACLLFSHNVWETKCITSNFAINVDGEYRIRCSCSAAGLLSVFTTAPPVPVQYPDHNEVRITFDLTVQAIQRAVDKAGGFYAYDNVTVLRTTPVVVKRDLIGDGNARKAMITIDRSFQNVIGNDSSSVATKWCESISSMLRVSVYRFKNPRVVIGILFNLTITLPFEDELTPLSAEEISLMLVESSKYHEFDLQSIQGETLPVQPITNNDIVELIVDRQLNALVLVLIIVISSLLVVASLYLGGAVIVKVRTDRLVAEERNKLIQLQPVTPPAAPPQYTTTVSPAVALADRYPVDIQPSLKVLVIGSRQDTLTTRIVRKTANTLAEDGSEVTLLLPFSAPPSPYIANRVRTKEENYGLKSEALMNAWSSFGAFDRIRSVKNFSHEMLTFCEQNPSAGDMSYFERAKTVIVNQIEGHILRRDLIRRIDDVGQRMFGERFTPFEEAVSQASFLLVNSDELLDYDRSLNSQWVYVGGLDTRKPSELNEVMCIPSNIEQQGNCRTLKSHGMATTVGCSDLTTKHVKEMIKEGMTDRMQKSSIMLSNAIGSKIANRKEKLQRTVEFAAKHAVIPTIRSSDSETTIFQRYHIDIYGPIFLLLLVSLTLLTWMVKTILQRRRNRIAKNSENGGAGDKIPEQAEDAEKPKPVTADPLQDEKTFSKKSEDIEDNEKY
ncbi:unnamed protein product [Nippostrongylus brasiliensis]|uniref:glucuronosyltransferase n=1 Tax=Nippostrongylus brasiliensis TaxID=27835 RepID=A0A158R1T6_NIPBR|nr:unnamed protein product [Nippostrongylus brasiliensis]